MPEFKPVEAIGAAIRIRPEQHAGRTLAVKGVIEHLLQLPAYPPSTQRALDLTDIRGKRILDCGTGTGVAAEALNDMGGVVTGVDVDISDASTRSNIFGGGLTPTPDVVQYLNECQKQGKKFDLICAFNAYSIDLLKLCRASSYALEDNGKIVITVGHEKEPEILNLIMGPFSGERRSLERDFGLYTFAGDVIDWNPQDAIIWVFKKMPSQLNP